MIEKHSVIPLPQDYNVKDLERHQGTWKEDGSYHAWIASSATLRLEKAKLILDNLSRLESQWISLAKFYVFLIQIKGRVITLESHGEDFNYLCQEMTCICFTSANQIYTLALYL